MDFPINNGDFPVRYVSSPEGKSYKKHQKTSKVETLEVKPSLFVGVFTQVVVVFDSYFTGFDIDSRALGSSTPQVILVCSDICFLAMFQGETSTLGVEGGGFLRPETSDTIHVYYTSSTAQGGGGSFKNRKPIGDIGCCESGMAERSH